MCSDRFARGLQTLGEQHEISLPKGRVAARCAVLELVESGYSRTLRKKWGGFDAGRRLYFKLQDIDATANIL